MNNKKSEILEVLLVLGENIKKSREKRNQSIQELAVCAAYDRNSLSQLEYGERNISYLTAVKLAEVLNISFPMLFSRNFLVDDADGFYKDDFLLVYIENVKRELRLKGMTQTRIYIESGVQESVISRILNRKVNGPTIETLWKIAVVVSDGDLCSLFSRKK